MRVPSGTTSVGEIPGPMPLEIVGVVKDMKVGDLKEEPRPWTFAAALQDASPERSRSICATARHPLALAPATQQAVHRLDAALGLRLEDRRRADRGNALPRPITGLAGSGVRFPGDAACFYRTVRHHRVQRDAAHAGDRDPYGSGGGARQCAAAGNAGGVDPGRGRVARRSAGDLALGRVLESQLFQMKAGDPAVIAGATGVVLLVSALAGYIPARRAARMDPMQALRWE